MKILALWQFPVKGIGGSKVQNASLLPKKYFPNDRQFAVSIGSEKAAVAEDGTWLKKQHFLQLMNYPYLAKIKCNYDGIRHKLEFFLENQPKLSIDPKSAKDQDRLERFFSKLFKDHLVGRPRLMEMKTQAYTDQPNPLISIASDKSLKAFAQATNTDPDNRRFRLNVIVESDTPFTEQQLIGKTLRCGSVLIKLKDPVGRCAAINVNPETAEREKDYLKIMRTEFGHTNLGVFGEIASGGSIEVDDHFYVE